MKKCLALGLFSSAIISAAIAEDSTQMTENLASTEKLPITVELELGVYSHDIRRGVVRDGTCMQGSAKVSSNGFCRDLDELRTSESSDFSDNLLNLADYTFGYEGVAGAFDFSVGTTIYTAPNNSDIDSTYEVFATAEMNNLFVTPYAEINYDINEINGFYGKVGVENDIDVSDSLLVTFGASAGFGCDDYNAAYFGKSRSSVLDGVLYAKASYAVSETLSLNGIVSYIEILDDGINSYASNNEEYTCGASIAMRF